MCELEKLFLKNRVKTKNQCQKAACEQKPLARNGNLVETKI